MSIARNGGALKKFNCCRRLCREDGGAGKSYTVPFERLVEADPEWLIIAPCGLDLAVTRQEMGPLVEQPAWCGRLRSS